MKNRMLVILTVFIMVVSLAACGGATPAPKPAESAQQQAQPQANVAPTKSEAGSPAAGALDGKSLVAERCTKCHNMDRIVAKKASADGWKTTVERMMGKGAKLSDAEKQTVIDYLAATYPQ